MHSYSKGLLNSIKHNSINVSLYQMANTYVHKLFNIYQFIIFSHNNLLNLLFLPTPPILTSYDRIRPEILTLQSVLRSQIKMKIRSNQN